MEEKNGGFDWDPDDDLGKQLYAYGNLAPSKEQQRIANLSKSDLLS